MKHLLTILMVLAALLVKAQNVVIAEAESTADASAILDVQSDTKGILIPRMRENQRNLIDLPATGLLVFQTDGASGFYFYDGARWVHLVTDESLSGEITSTGSGKIITDTERDSLKSALQQELDPVFSAAISDAGSGKVMSDAERTMLNTALQTETDPEFKAVVTGIGSGKIITDTERDSIKTALQKAEFTSHPSSNLTSSGSNKVITNAERTSINDWNASEAKKITKSGSKEVITGSERDSIKTALQKVEFTGHPAYNITMSGSGKVITGTERDSIKSALQKVEFTGHQAYNITHSGSGKVITDAERDSLKSALQVIDYEKSVISNLIIGRKDSVGVGLSSNFPGIDFNRKWDDDLEAYTAIDFDNYFSAINQNPATGDLRFLMGNKPANHSEYAQFVAAVIDTAGRMGLGTTTPQQTFQVKGTGSFLEGDYGEFTIKPYGNRGTSLTLQHNSTEGDSRNVINFSDQILNDRGYIMHQSNNGVSTLNLGFVANGATTTTLKLTSDEITYNKSLTLSSDKRLKRDITDLSESLSKVLQLRGVHFYWNTQLENDENRIQTGFIAQEVEKVFPELVHTDSEGFLSVNYIGFTSILLESIKEQQAMIEKMQNKSILDNAALEAKLLSLSEEVENLQKLITN